MRKENKISFFATSCNIQVITLKHQLEPSNTIYTDVKWDGLHNQHFHIWYFWANADAWLSLVTKYLFAVK